MRRILLWLTAIAIALLLGWALYTHHHHNSPGQDPVPVAAPSTLLAPPVPTTATPAGGSGVQAWSPSYTPTTSIDTTWQSAAEQFTRAFAQPTTTSGALTPSAGAGGGATDPVAKAWWAKVSPWFTPAAQQAFTGTDPRQVPFTRVTGPAVLVDSGYPPSVLAMAKVPTDHGDWYVAMLRYKGNVHVSWCGSDVTEMPR